MDLKNGAFSGNEKALLRGSKQSEAEILKEFDIVKEGKIFTPSFIDTGADAISVTFIVEDKRIDKANVNAEFISDKSGIKFEFNSTTDDKGCVDISLPPGKFITKVFPPGSATPLEVKHVVKDRPEILDFEAIPEMTEINIISQSQICVYLPSSIRGGSNIVVLGDISGSMRSDQRMAHLKKTLLSMYEESMLRGCGISLAVWDTSTYFANDSRYLTREDEDSVKEWVNARSAQGGNEMRQAIQCGMEKFPDAKHVFVMCDGDIAPFNFDTWRGFTGPYVSKGVHFHTVAFAEDSQHEMMQEMANFGGGTFTSANKFK